MKPTLDAISPNGACSAKKSLTAKPPSRRKARKKDHTFTLGIDEEFQIIDPKTRELRSHIQEILADGRVVLKEHVKAEMHQSVV